jgi:hypothetical protein
VKPLSSDGETEMRAEDMGVDGQSSKKSYTFDVSEFDQNRHSLQMNIHQNDDLQSSIDGNNFIKIRGDTDHSDKLMTK